jgi:hypothetical protein
MGIQAAGTNVSCGRNNRHMRPHLSVALDNGQTHFASVPVRSHQQVIARSDVLASRINKLDRSLIY